MVKRDNFSQSQRDAAFKANADEVSVLWRDEFPKSGTPHYMCEHCRFVHARRDYFEVDHLVSCLEGGTANRQTVERIAAIEAELAKPLDKQDIGLLALANLNSQVLCRGCNQGKKGSGPRPDDIPAACGYAWAKRDEDMNPDHRYAGPPRVAGYIKPRYRKNLVS